VRVEVKVAAVDFNPTARATDQDQAAIELNPNTYKML